MAQTLSMADGIDYPCRTAPIDQRSGTTAKRSIIVQYLCQRVWQVICQLLTRTHRNHARLLQGGSDMALVIRQHQQHTGQAQTATLPRRAACRADGDIRLCHPLRHVGGMDDNLTIKRCRLGKGLHAGSVWRGFAHHHRHADIALLLGMVGLQGVQHRQRHVIAIHTAQIKQKVYTLLGSWFVAFF